jgi:hypothetical protein
MDGLDEGGKMREGYMRGLMEGRESMPDWLVFHYPRVIGVLPLLKW